MPQIKLFPGNLNRLDDSRCKWNMPSTSSNRIEVWRSEVQSSLTSSASSSEKSTSPSLKQPKFWTRFWSRKNYIRAKAGAARFSPDDLEQGIDPNLYLPKRKGEVERTSMYSLKKDEATGQKKVNARGIPIESNGGSSMYIEGDE